MGLSEPSNIPPFVSWLERLLCHRPPQLSQPTGNRSFDAARHGGQASRPLKDGMTIAVVGGGLAGPLFARQLLSYTRENGPYIKVVIFDQTDCNYCAGLMTFLAGSSLQSLCGLTVPEEVILTTIGGCIYVNSSDSTCITVNNPLVSMLRTDRFSEAGFDDASLDCPSISVHSASLVTSGINKLLPNEQDCLNIHSRCRSWKSILFFGVCEGTLGAKKIRGRRFRPPPGHHWQQRIWNPRIPGSPRVSSQVPDAEPHHRQDKVGAY